MKYTMIALAGLTLTMMPIVAQADGGDRIEQHFDHKGDRMDQRLDRRGERINARLDRRGESCSQDGACRGRMPVALTNLTD